MEGNGGRYDAIVVGARAAGAATAMLLARAGLRVLAIDRGRYGSDTLSTHALMRGAVLQLSRWGLLPAIEAAGTPPVRTTSFHYEQDVVRIDIKPRDGIESLFAPRRHVLDRVIADAAIGAGADVQYGVTLTGLLRDDSGRVTGIVAHDQDRRAVEARADIVIGADGLRSTVARLVDAPVVRSGRHAAAVVYAYWPDLPVSGFEWHWSEGVASGAIPTNAFETCVFVALPAGRFADTFQHDLRGGYHRVLARTTPLLAAEVGWSMAVPRLQGFAGHPGYVRRSWGPGWALVGDAAYFKDPITAHGLTDAMRDAELLAEAILGGTRAGYEEYQRRRDELSLPLFEISDRIASFDWNLDSIRDLHHRLSDEMAREVDALRSFSPVCWSHA